MDPLGLARSPSRSLGEFQPNPNRIPAELKPRLILGSLLYGFPTYREAMDRRCKWRYVSSERAAARSSANGPRKSIIIGLSWASQFRPLDCGSCGGTFLSHSLGRRERATARCVASDRRRFQRKHKAGEVPLRGDPPDGRSGKRPVPNVQPCRPLGSRAYRAGLRVSVAEGHRCDPVLSRWGESEPASSRRLEAPLVLPSL